MEEKHVWMLLSLGLLVFCIFVTVLLVMNAGGLESKKKYNELKVKYVDLANKQVKTLKTALDMKASSSTSPTVVEVGKTAEELTPQVIQLQDQVKAQGTKVSQWQEDLLIEYRNAQPGQELTEDYIRQEIVRLNNEATEYSKKEK